MNDAPVQQLAATAPPLQEDQRDPAALLPAAVALTPATLARYGAEYAEVVREARSKGIHPRNVYVASLPISFTEQRLIALFSVFGRIESVKISCDPRGGATKGFGFVLFAHPDGAARAVEAFTTGPMAQKLIEGCQIQARLAKLTRAVTLGRNFTATAPSKKEKKDASAGAAAGSTFATPASMSSQSCTGSPHLCLPSNPNWVGASPQLSASGYTVPPPGYFVPSEAPPFVFAGGGSNATSHPLMPRFSFPALATDDSGYGAGLVMPDSTNNMLAPPPDDGLAGPDMMDFVVEDGVGWTPDSSEPASRATSNHSEMTAAFFLGGGAPGVGAPLTATSGRASSSASVSGGHYHHSGNGAPHSPQVWSVAAPLPAGLASTVGTPSLPGLASINNTGPAALSNGTGSLNNSSTSLGALPFPLQQQQQQPRAMGFFPQPPQQYIFDTPPPGAFVAHPLLHQPQQGGGGGAAGGGAVRCLPAPPGGFQQQQQQQHIWVQNIDGSASLVPVLSMLPQAFPAPPPTERMTSYLVPCGPAFHVFNSQ